MNTLPEPCLLLVDDDELVRIVLTMGLREEGFHVVEAPSGEEALGLISNGLNPSVVVTDINLGSGCSGVHMADRLAVSHPGVRVILMSACQEPQAREGQGEARPFLAKPFALAALSRLARE
jgi:DNA-binding NtrC family response regulator